MSSERRADPGSPGANDVERFRTAVSRRLGLAFEDSKLSFLWETLVERSAAAGASTADYVQRLEVDGSSEMRREVGRLAQALTVTETFFFRHGAQIRAFEETCLQPLAAQQQIRVLSAGCASGEEPYSLAIAILQRWPEARSPQVSIQGVDINPAMLAKAREARYSSWSLRETPEDVQRRWFRREGRESVLDARVRSLVTIGERNLVEEDDAAWPAGAYHVIFCRNVLMYLAPQRARGVVAKLARSLRPGGLLFLGHAETLRNLSSEFHLVHTHGAFFYQLRDASQPDALFSTEAQVTPALMAPLSEALDSGVSWVEAIQQSSERILALSRSVGGEAGPIPAEARSKSVDLSQILNLVREERFEEALALLDKLPPQSRDPDVLQLTAALLVQAGRRSEAQRLAKELLRIDDLNVGAHFVLALCSEHSGERETAVDHNRLAIHLDPTFSMPHLHLGILAKRANQRGFAHREFSQAVDLLGREDASRLLLFGGGFGREALVAFCRAELTTCEGMP